MVPDHDDLQRFAQFRAGSERLFTAETCHPSAHTGFCPCGGPLLQRLRFYGRGTLMELVMKLPGNRSKVSLLRRVGATVGRGVYVSQGAWIDPLFPDLLTIENNVLIGHDAKITMHGFGPDRFYAGRVILRARAVIGGFAVIAPGVEVGEDAVVAAAAFVTKDVPPGMTAIGNPARNVRRT